jgi:hypothetical protein
MDANEDFIFPGNRFFDVLDSNDVRRPVSAIDGGFHATLACSFHL